MPKQAKTTKGIHRVKKTLANGDVREYHYAFRGGPKFWSSEDSFGPEDPKYTLAFSEAFKATAPVEPQIGLLSTKAVIDRFYRSADFIKLAPRTKSDYEKYLKSFENEFGEDPIAMFEEKESRAEINEWKNQWAHSAKMYDYAGTVATRLLNWAMEEEKIIATHHHQGVKKLYKSDRSDIIWLPDEIDALLAVATPEEARIVIAASEGGLTPQDIGILQQKHVQRTPDGRRLYFKRTKSGKPTSIPVTPALDELIDSTPKTQKYLVVALEGGRLTPERASQIVRDLKERANLAAAADDTKTSIRDELRLYDMRGTAATELLRAGCSLNEIAVTMGWGLRHAANIIEKYAAVIPEVADEVLAKLSAAKKVAAKDQKA